MPFQIQLMLINVILYVWWYITILKKCSNLFRNFICSIGFIFYCFPRIRKDPIRNRPNRGPKIGPYACVFFFFQNLWSWSHLWKVSCFYPKVQWDSYSLSSISPNIKGNMINKHNLRAVWCSQMSFYNRSSS